MQEQAKTKQASGSDNQAKPKERLSPTDTASGYRNGVWSYDDEFKMACAWLEADGRFAPTAFIKTPAKTLVLVLQYDDSPEAKALLSEID